MLASPAPGSIPETSPPAGIGARATWGVRQLLIGGGAVALLLFLLGAAVVLPATEAFGENSGGSLLAQALFMALWDGGMVLIVYRLVRGSGGDWRMLGLGPLPARADGRSPTRRLMGTIVLAYVASVAFVQAYGIAVDALGLEDLLPSEQIPGEFYEHDWVLPFLGFAVVAAAPFAEELFFRGFLYAGLRRRLMLPVAALLSGGLFSLAHFDPGLIIPFTAVGFILAYAYERSGTLWAPISVHLLFNLGSFLVLVFVPGARDG